MGLRKPGDPLLPYLQKIQNHFKLNGLSQYPNQFVTLALTPTSHPISEAKDGAVEAG